MGESPKMSAFVRTFECNNKPVVVTFTPVANGLLAVTAEMEGRPLAVKGAAIISDQTHLRPGRYPAALKLYKRDGYYSHEIRASGGHGDFSCESETSFEMNLEMTELTIFDSSSISGVGGPP